MEQSYEVHRALEHLYGMRQEVFLAQRKQRNAVILARKSGASWQAVADTLGMSKNGCWQAYHQFENDPVTPYLYPLPTGTPEA